MPPMPPAAWDVAPQPPVNGNLLSDLRNSPLFKIPAAHLSLIMFLHR